MKAYYSTSVTTSSCTELGMPIEQSQIIKLLWLLEFQTAQAFPQKLIPFLCLLDINPVIPQFAKRVGQILVQVNFQESIWTEHPEREKRKIQPHWDKRITHSIQRFFFRVT